jgi:hypothetical protein
MSQVAGSPFLLTGFPVSSELSARNPGFLDSTISSTPRASSKERDSKVLVMSIRFGEEPMQERLEQVVEAAAGLGLLGLHRPD